eukprot:479453_1
MATLNNFLFLTFILVASAQMQAVNLARGLSAAMKIGETAVATQEMDQQFITCGQQCKNLPKAFKNGSCVKDCTKCKKPKYCTRAFKTTKCGPWGNRDSCCCYN